MNLENQKISSVEELEKELSVEKLENRLEMVQLAFIASKANAEGKNNCICDNDTDVDAK